MNEELGLGDERGDESEVVIGLEEMCQSREEVSEDHGAEADFPEHRRNHNFAGPRHKVLLRRIIGFFHKKLERAVGGVKYGRRLCFKATFLRALEPRGGIDYAEV